jgi:AraC-like DNA-binding protein
VHFESVVVDAPPLEWERLLGGRVTVAHADPADQRYRPLGPGGVNATALSTGPATVRHTPVPGTGIVDFWYVAEGSVLAVQDGRSIAAQAGDLVSTDRNQALKLRFTRPSTKALHVPLTVRRLGLTPVEARAVAGRRWTRDKGPATLLLSVLGGLAASIDECDDAAFQPFAHHLTDLIACAAAEAARSHGGDREVRTAMLKRIQGYAKLHLDDPSLDLASLARQHGVSVRYVQKLFQEHGLSPTKWIRRERLSRCLADLQDPHKSGVSVAMIGRCWGFLTPSYFTRAFRQEYGLTPRQIRAATQPEGAR